MVCPCYPGEYLDLKLVVSSHLTWSDVCAGCRVHSACAHLEYCVPACVCALYLCSLLSAGAHAKRQRLRLPSHPTVFAVGSHCQIHQCAVTCPRCDGPPTAMEMHKSTSFSSVPSPNTSRWQHLTFCSLTNSLALVRDAASS